MKEFIKSIKENVGAIITALVVFGLVSNYLINVIPNNQAQIDTNNRARLKEFENQFNSVLKDYASQLPFNQFEKSVNESTGETNDASTSYVNNLLVHSIRIVQIGDTTICRDSFFVKEAITYSIDSLEQKKLYGKVIFKNLAEPKVVYLPYLISKTEFIQKLSQATSFPYWMVYLESTDTLKTKDRIFLSKDIETSEVDSLLLHQPKNGINTFEFSSKRYYRKSFALEGTQFKIVLTGAINQSTFENEARQTDVSLTILCCVLVVILFLIIPLLKPLISSAKERLTQFDLITTTGSICTAAVILSVTIFTWYFSKKGNNDLKSELITIHSEIEKLIDSELNSYVKSKDVIFKYIDSVKASPHNKLELIEKQYAGKHLTFPEIAFEMDKNGLMTFDVMKSSHFTVRKNYSDRDYVRKINSGDYDKVLSAVFSKYDNKFKTVYVQEEGNHMRGFAFQPTKIDLKKKLNDYGFILCDKDGRVLLHSDSTKRLNENLFSVCQHASEFLELTRGYNEDPFETDYDGCSSLFYGKRFDYVKNNKSMGAPVYLFTFKKLSFEDNLKTYSIIKGIIISVAFSIVTMLLLLFYSVFFYSGHLSVFSKSHVYWLFPDKSRIHEFRFLTKLNLITCGAVLLLLWMYPNHGLFIAFICGIHIAFFNFVLLTQRVFLFNQPSQKRTKYFNSFIFIMIAGLVVSWILYKTTTATWALGISIAIHLCFLWFLKKERHSVKLAEIEKSIKGYTYNYGYFLFSIISYHYLLVPAIVVFSIFVNETGRSLDYANSLSNRRTSLQANLGESCKENSDWYQAEDLLNKITSPSSPSFKILQNIEFDDYYASGEKPKVAHELLYKLDPKNIAWLILSLILIGVIILTLTRFFIGRFFFNELSELAQKTRAHRMAQENALPDIIPVFPPFHKRDLRRIEKSEIGFIPDYIYPSSISNPGVSQYKKLELIFSKALEVHKRSYAETWHRLSDDEKFVMYDFAIDYFVNNQNKLHLISLINKGLIIDDPVTGRLRVINYGFRNFVIWYEKKDPSFSAEEMERSIKGTFAKWRLPLIIIAVSVLLLVSYLYKEQCDRIMIFGGSTISAIALIARFLNNYKAK